MKVTIIIPAYNEEMRIGKTLDAYTSYFKNLQKSISWNIIVVVNNTKDNTVGIIKSRMKNSKSISYVDLKKGGKGYAIIEGCKIALKGNPDLIGFVDADGASPPQAFHALILGIKDADAVIASRWLPQSVIKTRQSMLRRITSRGFNFLVRSFFLMPYTDTQCGAKIFKREVIQKVISQIGTTRWAFDVDLIYKVRKNGFRLIEIPTIYEDNKDTKLNIFKAPLEMFLGILRLRLINSPFRFIVRAYDSIPESIKLHHKIK